MTVTARRVASVAFWTLAAVAVAAHAIVLWQSIVVTRLWEDEAFNLTVPLNLLRGLGYSSDGALSGSTITPFDPRISTGPVVLVPIAGVLAFGGDIAISARLVPAAFFVALLVALALLGRRIGGRWAALAAVVAPLALHTTTAVSPIQGPADILGEIPAAALCAWALVVLHRRPWLAGLLLGLAVQTKYISLLFVPAFAIALWLQTPGLAWRARVRRALWPAALVIAPTVLVELIALLSLGPTGYVAHVRDTVAFVRSGGQTYQGTTIGDKLTTLFDNWYVPGLVALIAAIIALAVLIVAALRARRDPTRLDALIAADGLAHRRELIGVAVVAVVGLAAFVGWWSFASQTPLWIRHPSPGLFALAPVLVAFVVLALRVLGRVASAVGGVLLAVLLAVQTQAHVAQSLAAAPEDLATQRTIAADVAALDNTHYAAVWGGPVSIVVLSGAHVGLWDAGANVDGWPRMFNADNTGCLAPSEHFGWYVVCAPASMPVP